MKRAIFLAAMIVGAVVPATAQDAGSPGLGEVIVTANRGSARYAQQDRPVVGLRRQADSAVVQVSFSSDSRDETTRKREIHTMLVGALDRAAAAGVELVTGNFELIPVTKTNYSELPFNSAGRVDTSQVSVTLKTRLAGSTVAATQRLDGFIKAVPRSGRGAIDKVGTVTLTIVNPDQYRDVIIKLIADSAKQHAAIFGADYAVQVSGIDGQLFWSQISDTDVFLYVPYRFTIIPHRILSEK